tara:strand:- start:1957 stop:2376 length:420 start_codon:yes stop_codon:yes gene_type:complete
MFHAQLRQSKNLLAAAIILVAAVSSTVAAGHARAASELLMVEQSSCAWCTAWNTEIGGIYHLTDEGKRAPLRRQDLFDPWPEGLKINGQVHFTPTFILLENGTETGRIEGYPGEDFFWPLLARLLDKKTRKTPPTEGND